MKLVIDFDFTFQPSVRYGTLADLITALEEVQAAGRLHERLKGMTAWRPP